MTILALAREHVCILKAPVLRAVDTEIFRLRYFTHCMSCGFCRDQCCSYGVDIDIDNAAALCALGPDFKALIGIPESQWFGEEIADDPEFPSGRNLRTRVRDGHCVFHNRDGRGCRIHAYCVENGLDYHLYKPMVSILFPLTFEQGCLVPSSEAVDGSLVCAGDGPSLYEGGRGELGHFFGSGLVAELDAIEAESLE